MPFFSTIYSTDADPQSKWTSMPLKSLIRGSRRTVPRHPDRSHRWGSQIAILLAGILVALTGDSASAESETAHPGVGPKLILSPPLRAVPAKQEPGTPFALSGAAFESELADPRYESDGRGIVLPSKSPNGSAAWQVTGIDTNKAGRWFNLRIRALAQDNFKVGEDKLFLRVDFYSLGGKRSLDQITKNIYDQVERERLDLADKGTNPKLGHATWRNYAIKFRLPFPEIDTVRLTVGFDNGAGIAELSEFRVNEIELAAIPTPSDYVSPPNVAGAKSASKPPALEATVAIGGRWYYDPRGGSKEIPKQFDHTNSDRLLYLGDRLEAPFAGNMSAWRRKGYLDRDGKTVEEDQFVPENVVINFTNTHLVMKSHNLPDHPTAVFPDRWRMLDGNPNYIKEQDYTWYIPLNPTENTNHVAMDANNSNRALPGGAIGVAINGVILFNPFDESMEVDAVWRVDRCCGHPSPMQSYHYHKYPVCVNTPWSDDGQSHSPLIGFMFDGFSIYGPYESAGVMAEHSEKNPLNAFNGHDDEARGWHYHVTPGKYPHIIGGFWGTLDPKNRIRRGPPPGPTGPPGIPRRF
ncbi:MAG: YHYH protein [Luteolibacter sp.]